MVLTTMFILCLFSDQKEDAACVEVEVVAAAVGTVPLNIKETEQL